MRALLKHIGIVLTALLLLLGIPALLWTNIRNIFSESGADAVSRATMELPEQPSGSYLVLLNTDRHTATANQWRDFFMERPTDVIMEDIDCLAIDADAGGIQLAERYQARLAENQMRIRHENGLLTVSKAEQGLFDVIILSLEMANAYGLSTDRTDIQVITTGADSGDD